MRYILIAIFLLISTSLHASIAIVDGSFENPAVLSSGIPDVPGFWGGDICEIVGSSDGITPYNGTQMVKFINTTTYGPSLSSVESQLYQFISLNEYQDYIETGLARVTVSFYINRIMGDSNTDSEFKVGIEAFSGNPENYPNTNFITRMDSVAVSKNSDAEISTWELIQAELTIPAGSEYLCIIISAGENNKNDGAGIEFDGHYGDQVDIEVSLPLANEKSSWGKIKSIIHQ